MLEIAKKDTYYLVTNMRKHRRKNYKEKMIECICKMPMPIQDRRHNLEVYIINSRARSNETRFEHIIDERHKLLPSDLKRIVTHLKSSLFKKDKERKGTFNYYIKRNSYNEEYIKVSVQIEPNEPSIATVKTIYITKLIK